MYQTNNLTYFVNELNKYSTSWQYSGVSHLTTYEHSLDGKPDIQYPDSLSSEDDDIGEIFRDNLRFQKISTAQAFYLIKERDALCDHNIDLINSRTRYCHDNLSRLNMARRYMIEPQVNFRRIDGLQRMLLDLERQERDERVNAWRDTLKLKLGLPEMLKGYQNLKRQESLLNDAV
jgi:hypothetical protein